MSLLASTADAAAAAFWTTATGPAAIAAASASDAPPGFPDLKWDRWPEWSIWTNFAKPDPVNWNAWTPSSDTGEQAQADQCRLGHVLHNGGPLVRGLAQSALAGTPQDRRDALTENSSAESPVDLANDDDWETTPPPSGFQTEQQKRWLEQINKFQHHSDAPEFDTTTREFRRNSHERTSQATFADLVPRAGKESLDRVTEIIGETQGSDEYFQALDKFQKELAALMGSSGGTLKDLSVGMSADDARAFLQFGGFPKTAPAPGTIEHRTEIESLKVRWSNCDFENPADPYRVMGEVVETARTEWQAELDAQAPYRNTIVTAEAAAYDDLWNASFAMVEAVGQAWVAEEVLAWQRSQGPNWQPTAAQKSQIETELQNTQTRINAQLTLAKSLADDAAVQASKADTAQAAANEASTAAVAARKAATEATGAAERARAAADGAKAAAATTHAQATAAHAAAADAIEASKAAAGHARAAEGFSRVAAANAVAAKANAAEARSQADQARAESAVTAGQAFAAAQAATAAGDAAKEVIDPANEAISLGSPYQETDASAGMAVLVGQNAMTLADQQAAAAQAKADEAARAAEAAEDAADRADADSKLAAEAAATASAQAAKAAVSVTQARASAKAAAADAAAAQTAAANATEYDIEAQGYAATADTAATAAESEAAAARNAATEAELDAEGAHNAADAAQSDADSADSIAQYAEEAAVRAEAAAANAQASAVAADEAATRAEEALRQRIEAARAERAEGAVDTGAELSGEEEAILLRLCGQSCVDEWRAAKNATAQDVLDWIKANGGEIILDVVGYTDAKTCFTKGDIEACLWTLIYAASIAVVVVKLPALTVGVARVTAGITKFFEASAKGKRTLRKLRDLIERARKDPNTPPCAGKGLARAAADDVCNLDWEIGDLPYETLDDLDKRYGSDVTDGVEYNWRKMQQKGADGKPTKNAIDHAIPGIGTNVEKLAQYWAKWRGKATHIDPSTKNTVAFDEAKGVLVVIKSRYIHGYRMTKAKFLEKFDPLPPS